MSKSMFSGTFINVSEDGASATLAGVFVTLAGASVTLVGASVTLAGASVTLAGASVTLAGASVTLAGASATLAGASATLAGVLLAAPAVGSLTVETAAVDDTGAVVVDGEAIFDIISETSTNFDLNTRFPLIVLLLRT